MAAPNLGDALRDLAERTSGGVRKARIVQVLEGGALVQEGKTVSLATTTTDEPLRAGDQVYVQPTQPAGRLVIHGKA